MNNEVLLKVQNPHSLRIKWNLQVREIFRHSRQSFFGPALVASHFLDQR